MKKLLLIALTLVLVMVPSVKAGKGNIRIETPDGEYWPVMLESPVTFETWVEGGGAAAYDPHILLVMTRECYDGLGVPPGFGATEPCVVVSYGITHSFVLKTAFTGVSGMGGEYVPPSGTTQGARYTVASLKGHLDYDLSVPLSADDTIYWALSSFLDGPILSGKENAQTFTVNLQSSAPRMLVYALGRSSETAPDLDMNVPPTRPGFIIPELGPILLALASFSAFAIYAIRRRKVHLK